MGFFDDMPAPSLRRRESEPAGPVLYPFAVGRRSALVRTPVVDPGREGTFVPDSGLSAGAKLTGAH